MGLGCSIQGESFGIAMARGRLTTFRAQRKTQKVVAQMDELLESRGGETSEGPIQRLPAAVSCYTAGLVDPEPMELPVSKVLERW